MTKAWTWLLIPVALGALALGGCGDDDDSAPAATATAQPGSPTASTTTAQTLTAGATGTAKPATPSASATAAADGTVDPLNAGDTASVTTKPDSEAFRPQPQLQDVRMGVHPEQGGWDRIVFEFKGGLPGARIEYIDQAVACGSGKSVTVEGTARLSVRFDSAANHDAAGKPTFASQSVDGPGKTILGAVQTCDFEGVVTWVAGISGKQNFKVTTLQDPPRLVIDVKQ
ncbi:MAG: hypothetical protein HYX53_01480 [Chloroflexi bacterium]|nr:hypothetical protein [Chloroflexota bacterium]